MDIHLMLLLLYRIDDVRMPLVRETRRLTIESNFPSLCQFLQSQLDEVLLTGVQFILHDFLQCIIFKEEW